MIERNRGSRDISKELLENEETPLERAMRAVKFIMNPFTGRHDSPAITQHLVDFKDCLYLIRDSQNNLRCLIEQVNQGEEKNGQSRYKRWLAELMRGMIKHQIPQNTD